MWKEGIGKGYGWAEEAHYTVLQEALHWKVENGHDPREHPNYRLREYFEQTIAENYELGFDDNGFANDSLVRFLSGWKTGVEQFWNEVKDEIQMEIPKATQKALSTQ